MEEGREGWRKEGRKTKIKIDSKCFTSIGPVVWDHVRQESWEGGLRREK